MTLTSGRKSATAEPNPILALFRAERRQGYSASLWLSRLDEFDALPEHIEHARKVFTRLAAKEAGR